MTTKRFELAYADYDWWAICDKENPTELGISGEDVVVLLNEQHETIEQLKSKIKREIGHNQRLHKDNCELTKENKQLKKRNEFLKKQLDRVCSENEMMGNKLKKIGRIL